MLFIAHLRLPKRSVRTEVFLILVVYTAFRRRILAVRLLAPARIKQAALPSMPAQAALLLNACEKRQKTSSDRKDGERRKVLNTIGSACKKATKKP
jgi:hypothetical protein